MEWNINDVTEQAALNAQSMVWKWKETTKKRLFEKGGKKPSKHGTKSFSRTDIQNNKKRFLAQLKEAIKKHPEFNTPQWIQYFTTIADVETGGTFNENATSKTSSARGYFQILKPNRSTSNQFEDMFALTKQNQRALLAGLGKDGITKVMQNYTIPEIMALSHFQGANGAIKIFRGNKGVKDANGVSPYKYLNVFRNKIKNKKTVATIEENTNTSINSDLPFMETPLTALQIAQEYNGFTPQTPIPTSITAEELEIPEINVIPDVAKKELLRKAISQTLGLQASIPQTSKIAFDPRVFIDDINSEIINEEQQNLQNILLQDAINRNVSNSAFRYALANDAQKETGKQDQEIEMSQLLNQTALGGPLFNSRTPIESFQGKKSHLPVVRYDEGGNLNIYNAGELPEINIVGNNKPAIIMYDKNTGEYSRSSTGDILTPINTYISDNPADWTYQDKNGTLFTPHRQVYQGEITQGREQNGLDKLLQFSNQHYNDPIIGAAARWSNNWHNDRNPIKAAINYFDPTGLVGYGIDKGIDLYNKGTDVLGMDDAMVAGLSMLPIIGKGMMKAKKFTPLLDWSPENYFGKIGRHNRIPVLEELKPTAMADFTYKDKRNILSMLGDKFSDKQIYKRYMSGQKELLPGERDFIPNSDKGVFMKAPQLSLDILNNSTLSRMKAMRPWMKDYEIEQAVTPSLNKGYTLFPESTFIKAGEEQAGGLHFGNGNIAINQGSSYPASNIYIHKVRHDLQDVLPTTKEEESLLNASFEDLQKANEESKEFTSGIFENYDFMQDKETTNADARVALLGDDKSAKIPVNLQDKIIDKSSDKQIVEAMRKSNGYGRHLVEYYERNGGVPAEKIKAWRESMKKVGIITTPATITGVGLSTTSTNNQQALGGTLTKGKQLPQIIVTDKKRDQDGNLFLTGGEKIGENIIRPLHNKVYNNYGDAVDNNMGPIMTGIRKGLRYIKDNINDSVPAGISNCTLTATQWVDPTNPIMSAKTIVSNPDSVGYSKINADQVVPGDLLIAKVPGKDSYHTMYVSGFDKEGKPLLDYSRGGMGVEENLRTNIPLEWYTDNSDGHTQNLYYRNNKFNKTVLPEIIVTGKKKAEGGNLFQDGGNTLLTQNLPGIVVTRPYPSEQQIKQTIEKEWPSAVGLTQYRITKDPTFTRERTGAGSIEYFNEPSITYRNGTTVQNPNQEPTLLFDPNTNTVEDIKLDLLHHYREYDKEYQKLLLDYTNALIGNKHTASDLFWNSELGEQYRNKYGKDIEKHWDEWNQMVEENINNNQYLTQAIDGSLRSLMASDALREKSNYDTKEGAEASWLRDKYAKRAYNNIIKYLKTSKK